jgi:hypothetical protein
VAGRNLEFDQSHGLPNSDSSRPRANIYPQAVKNCSRLVSLMNRSRWRDGRNIVHPALDLNHNSPQRALEEVDGPAYGVTAEVPKNHAMLATVVEVGLYRDPQILHHLLASLL